MFEVEIWPRILAKGLYLIQYIIVYQYRCVHKGSTQLILMRTYKC